MSAPRTEEAAAGAAGPRGPGGDGETHEQIRGSSLLLAGQALSVLANLAIQVLIVRYLSKGDYGTFAYALSFVALGEPLATFGLDRALLRHAPIYQERGEYNRLWGAIVLAVGTTASVGAAFVLVVHGLSSILAGALGNQTQAMALLLVLIVLSPLQGLDNIMVGLFAVFASPRAIFFRRHVVGPGLRLLAVLGVIVSGGGNLALAYGWVAAGALGLLLYSRVLLRIWRQAGLLRHLQWRTLDIPVRAMVTFALPLLSTDLLTIVMHTSDAILLGWFGASEDVASIRAVQPLARANQLVMFTFGLLFTPLVARLHIRRDHGALAEAYQRTSAWIALLTLPVLLLTFSLATPLTHLLFGEQYASSGVILSLLAAGYAFDAIVGLSSLTLRIVRRLRAVVAFDLAAVATNLGLNLVLIPRYAALGAAMATCAALVLHGLLALWAMRRITGVSPVSWRSPLLYPAVALAAAGLLALERLASPSPAVAAVVGALLGLAVTRIAWPALRVAETFPFLAAMLRDGTRHGGRQ